MADFSRDDVMDNPFEKDHRNDEFLLFGRPVFPLFLRILGMIILIVSIDYWARIIGFNGPHLITLFLADNHTAIVDGILGVVLPALGVGLWLGASWGFFLWGLSSLGLILTHFAIEPVRYNHYVLGTALTILFLLYGCGIFLFKLSRKEWKKETKNKE